MPHTGQRLLRTMYAHLQRKKAIMTVKFPDIHVRLTGKDGNAMVIMATVTRALRQHKIGNDVIQAFNKEATSGNYDHMLQTCMAWVNVS